ncbi:hypothetical protein HDA40_005100 [Hamadaea flava]|uniref:Uncharacterized protein n=1 Tax=Hamadaea flava TaxID=1742688 RepID=A0ABV8LH65_9ACTN|nr:hypothetical protein [Hamadaea flava]MCP2326593.1 hypothetical protein [Hamadaea flava]
MSAWPLVALLALYPLWWALGLGVLIFPILAVPMVVQLVRKHRRGEAVKLPPGFPFWLLFLGAVIVGVAVLGADPDGVVQAGAAERVSGVAFRLVEYVSLTVLLIYAGNLPTGALSQTRLVKLLAWLFVVTVAGGLLGTFAGHFSFTSPVELLLPPGVRGKGFIKSLVHPYAAQIMDLVGDPQPRPAAPWGYTNTWGNNFCLLVVWFAVAVRTAAPRRVKTAALALLVVAAVPVVHSLNRGLWIGLGVTLAYVAVRQAQAGRSGMLLAGAGAAAALAGVLAVTPLGDVVTKRLENGKSNGVRMYLTERALDGFRQSPLVGFGSTRNTLGGRQSITVGESAACERCGNFTVGGNGQLWQLLFAHGAVGAVGYLGFFGYGLWRFRRDRTPIGIAGQAAIVGTFVAMFWYNSLVTPLAFTFLAYALLWRATLPKTNSDRGDA